MDLFHILEIFHKLFWKYSIFCNFEEHDISNVHMENEITIKRFIEIRRELGYTQTEFAKLLGISNTTADIERGRTKLSGRVVAELLKKFKINPLWLYGESNSMHLDTSKTSVIPKVVTVDSSEEREYGIGECQGSSRLSSKHSGQ